MWLKILAVFTWFKKEDITWRQWATDHEKCLIPIYIIAILMIFYAPQFLYPTILSALCLFRIYEIATDKSNSSMLKTLTTGVTTPQSPPAA